MKAIEINGEIKTYSSIPNSFKVNGKYIAGGGKNLSEEKIKELGFKDVVTPDIDYRIQELSPIYLNGDVYTYDVIEKPIKETLEELKQEKISELKSTTSSMLSGTDWYIIREADSGEVTPDSIKSERAALRTKSDLIEAEINALTTKKAVVLFDINL
jgi:hypothetical protein